MKITAVAKPTKSIKQYIAFIPQNKSLHLPDPDLNAIALDAYKTGMFSGKNEETLPIFQKGKCALLVGLGENPGELTARQLGKKAKTAARHPLFNPKKPVYLIPHDESPFVLRALVDGLKLGLYRWDKYITKTDEYIDYTQSTFQIQTQNKQDIDTYATIADGVNLARDLGNENADVADSTWIQREIKKQVQADTRCKLEVLNERELKQKGLNLHLAVNQGSNKTPKLLIVTYQGGKKSDPYTAFVGKGITFDSGGLHVKRYGAMEDMRMDMCGAAAVIGALKNTLALNIKQNAYFVVGLAENAVGPKAYKPGDVIQSYAGKTVEIGNTDAEGRLVLADANSYIAKNYKPDTIINIATLTGAALMALGHDYTALMSTHRDVAENLLHAAETTDDRAWQLPMYSELKEHVKSEVADIKNIGLPRLCGTLSAGEFLRQFAQHDNEKQKWAHLDIAGTAILDKELGYLQGGASGAGVRLFTEFLLQGGA